MVYNVSLYNISSFTGIFSNGLVSLFGAGVILGIIGLLVFFLISYKFNFPPILNFIVMGLAGIFIGQAILGDWVRAIVLIGFGTAIALIGYRILSG